VDEILKQSAISCTILKFKLDKLIQNDWVSCSRKVDTKTLRRRHFMAWKWYEIKTYKVSVGGNEGDYYDGVQLFGDGFFALLECHKAGPLPDASAPRTYGQRFYGYMDYQQMQMVVDLLRNEGPHNFGWQVELQNFFT
jgi:hypothetical protein